MNVPPVKFAAVAVKMAPPEAAVFVVNVVSVTESGLPMQVVIDGAAAVRRLNCR